MGCIYTINSITSTWSKSTFEINSLKFINIRIDKDPLQCSNDSSKMNASDIELLALVTCKDFSVSLFIEDNNQN